MQDSTLIFGPINSRRFGMSLGIDLSPKYVLQGNMEPMRLYSKEAIDAGVERILQTMKNAPHIFNLGHGILPDVPVENAKYFIKRVQEKSTR